MNCETERAKYLPGGEGYTPSKLPTIVFSSYAALLFIVGFPLVRSLSIMMAPILGAELETAQMRSIEDILAHKIGGTGAFGVMFNSIGRLWSEFQQNMTASEAVRVNAGMMSEVPVQAGVIGLAISGIAIIALRVLTGFSYGLAITTPMAAVIGSMWPALLVLVLALCAGSFAYYMVKKPKVLFGYLISPGPNCPATWGSMIRIVSFLLVGASVIYLTLCALASVDMPLQMFALSLLAIIGVQTKGAIGCKNQVVRHELEVIQETARAISAASSAPSQADAPIRLSLIYRAIDSFSSIRLEGDEIEGETAAMFAETINMISVKNTFSGIVQALQAYWSEKKMTPDQINTSLNNQVSVLTTTIDQMNSAKNAPSNASFSNSYNNIISQLSALKREYTSRTNAPKPSQPSQPSPSQGPSQGPPQQPSPSQGPPQGPPQQPPSQGPPPAAKPPAVDIDAPLVPPQAQKVENSGSKQPKPSAPFTVGGRRALRNFTMMNQVWQ